LYLKPTLTADNIGQQNLNSGTLDVWGSTPANLCTGNAFYGCSRVGGGGGNIINPIQSARIRTVNSFTFTYGQVEVRAKLPCGDWIWPAIWMLPRYDSYGDWPASGEIDIVESRGNKNYPNNVGGANTFGSTLHMGPSYQSDAWPNFHQQYTLSSGFFCDDFHIFGLIWNETNLQTYLDEPSNVILNVPFDQPFWTKGGWDKTTFSNPWKNTNNPNSAPFDQEYYLIFNLAVGGSNSYFPDGTGNKPWTNTDPHAVNAFWNSKDQWFSTWNGDSAALQIDWIRVSQ